MISDLERPHKVEQRLKELKSTQEKHSYHDELKAVKSRNILPNITNLIVSYIRRINKSGKVTKKIISKFKDDRYTVKRFYAYQIYLKSAINDYTSKNILHLIVTYNDPSSPVFKPEEQKLYNKVCRALIGHYLTNEGPLCLLTSNKEHKTQKSDHFKIYRYILGDLQHYYLETNE
jgi:hypothetical protein